MKFFLGMLMVVGMSSSVHAAWVEQCTVGHVTGGGGTTTETICWWTDAGPPPSGGGGGGSGSGSGGGGSGSGGDIIGVHPPGAPQGCSRKP